MFCPVSVFVFPAELIFRLMNSNHAEAPEMAVTVTNVAGQTFSFDTGAGMFGETNTVTIYVFNKCRLDPGGGRIPVGEFYPASSVSGIDVDASGIVSAPGSGNTIAITFVEGIAQNSDIFTDHGDGTATVEFCAQVCLYLGDFLCNWEEVKITYQIDLVTNLPTAEPVSWVSSAVGFLDSIGISTGLDGTLQTFFCDPNTFALLGEGVTAHQGGIISICFNIEDGQFEVEDIIDLIVEDLGASGATQAVIMNQGESAYAEKYCTISSPTTKTCVVSFILTAQFFDYNAFTLTGEGVLLLQLGDHDTTRERERILRRVRTRHVPENPSKSFSDKSFSRALQSTSATDFQVRAHQFIVDKPVSAANLPGVASAIISVISLIYLFE